MRNPLLRRSSSSSRQREAQSADDRWLSEAAAGGPSGEVVSRIRDVSTGVACEYLANAVATRSIVFIHGWMDSMGDADLNAPALAEHFNVLRFDLPGHGRSALAADYSLRTYVQAADNAIARFRPPNPILVGHSMGAMVAAALHGLDPERWSAVIMLDPPLRGSPLLRLWRPFVAAGRALGLLPFVAKWLRDRDRLVAWWCDAFDGPVHETTHFARLTTKRGLRGTDPRAIAQGLVDITANRMTLLEPPPDRPFVLVYGAHDPTIDAAKVARWFDPNRVTRIDDTRHTPNRVLPQVVNDVLARAAAGSPPVRRTPPGGSSPPPV